LRQELDAEIQRSTILASKPGRGAAPPSRGRVGQNILGSDDPKYTEIIKFYEDVTNLLVTNMKTHPATYLDLQEWTFSCVFTYTGTGTDDDIPKSTYPGLHFPYSIMSLIYF
jgi:hypothetical protein